MGLFLGNLHIHSKNDDGRKLSIEALRKIFAELGYEETEDAKEALVNINIVTSPDFRWTSAYCEEWESDPSALATISFELSKKAKVAVLNVAIHDSDTLTMELYDKGKLLDRFTNDPDSDDTASNSRGNPQKWKSVLDDSTTKDMLRTIWDAPGTFIEEKLPPLAKALNIPQKQFAALANELDECCLEKYLTFHFRKATSDLTQRICLEPLSLFVNDGNTSVGEILWKGPVFVNCGLPFSGFVLRLEGSAVRSGLISLNRVIAKYYTSSTKSANRIGGEQHYAQIEQDADDSVISCKFSDFKVTSPGDPEDRFRVSMHLFLKGEKEGAGELHIRMIPDADPNVAVSFKYPIKVAAPFRRPLKFTGNPQEVSYLRQMSNQKYLMGMAIARPSETIWTDAKPAFEHFISLLSAGEKKALTVTTKKTANADDKSPKKLIKQLDTTDFMQSKQWKNLTAEYQTYDLIAASVEDKFGIIYEIPFVTPTRPQPACTHIAFWTLMPDTEQLNECEKIIAGAIRQVMQNGALQGLMSKWDWIPKIGSWTYTPYEQACFGSNTGGSTTIESAEWCANYLRGVGNKIWLGTQLLERIGGPAVLEILPKASYCAPYSELDLDSDAELDRAETVLELILPGKADQ